MKSVLILVLAFTPCFIFGQRGGTASVITRAAAYSWRADSSIKDKDTVSSKVEIEASVDRDAWIQQLTKVLTPVIERAARKKMNAGTYTVQVRFLVEKDGSISDVVALNDPGYGLAQGAVRAVQSGPRWNAGSTNGKKVRSYHTQPVSFVISEQ